MFNASNERIDRARDLIESHAIVDDNGVVCISSAMVYDLLSEPDLRPMYESFMELDLEETLEGSNLEDITLFMVDIGSSLKCIGAEESYGDYIIHFKGELYGNI